MMHDMITSKSFERSESSAVVATVPSKAGVAPEGKTESWFKSGRVQLGDGHNFSGNELSRIRMLSDQLIGLTRRKDNCQLQCASSYSFACFFYLPR